MKIVRKSKNPSIQQMLRMASNLKEKFDKCSMVQADAWHFSSGTPSNKPCYYLYVEGIISTYHDSWV